jgi:hypothetical protein
MHEHDITTVIPVGTYGLTVSVDPNEGDTIIDIDDHDERGHYVLVHPEDALLLARALITADRVARRMQKAQVA